MPRRIKVSSDTRLDCAVVLKVGVVREGRLYEVFDSWPREAVSGVSIGAVSSHLQAQVHESLLVAFSQAINDDGDE